ncbi:unnamed protein product [Peniophora sp. CBMAI 1063]|nr:unnamed protein product [Peniophora sp. CBMAI 1063]
MRKSLTQNSQKEIESQTAQSTSHNSAQHGSSSQPCYLLDLPAESLTHITAYLDPQALFNFGRTNKKFSEHIKDDNIWHRAFVCQFLGVAPETDLVGQNSLVLRRSESSWKREFVLRFNTRRRWMRSRTSTITHSPHHALVSSLHMLSDDALLSSSLQYGVVARSLPFTGRVIKGFLNASGLHHGLANGNPNADFIPDVSACAVSSEGASARIAWGRRDGAFGIMWHPHTMAGSRAAANISMSRPEEGHRGAVNEAIFIRGGEACVTVGADGTAKVWSTRRFACVWTSPRPELLPEPYVKVLEDLARGVLVCATEKGSIVIYSGLPLASLLGPDRTQFSAEDLRTYRVNAPATDGSEVAQMFADLNSPADHTVLVVRHEGRVTFDRVDVNTVTGAITTSTFGDAAAGVVSVILPDFAAGSTNEHSYIIAGDTLGGVSIYPWDSPTKLINDQPISPSRRVDVFPDATVKALATTSLVIAAGSSRGDVRVLDVLTLEFLRTFTVASEIPVRNIVLRRELLIASAGVHVMAWKAGPVGKDGRAAKGKKKIKAKEMHQDRKWQKQIQFKHDIAEFRGDLELEGTSARAARGREREQAEHLGGLGLSEREAVEYVLMLSREEAFARDAGQGEEGVFELDDGASSTPSSGSTGSRSRTSSFLSPSPPFRATANRLPSTPPHRPIAEPSSLNHKVQVSPRFMPEPSEAGGLPGSLELPAPIEMRRAPPSEDAFPDMTPSSHGSTTPALRGAVTPPRASVWNPRPSASASPRGAWMTPLRTPPSTSPPVSRLASVAGSSLVTRLPSAASSSSAAQPSVARSPPFRNMAMSESAREQEEKWAQEAAAIATIEDEELRYALELSLAEARSQAP